MGPAGVYNQFGALEHFSGSGAPAALIAPPSAGNSFVHEESPCFSNSNDGTQKPSRLSSFGSQPPEPQPIYSKAAQNAFNALPSSA